MNRGQGIVTVFGLVVAGLAILFPPWDNLSYWEEIAEPSGVSSGSAVSVRGARHFVFTGPPAPQPSQPGAQISRYSPQPQIARLAIEVSFAMALTIFLVWVVRTPPEMTGRRRPEGMMLVHAAMLLYLVALPLPAITIAATPISGWQAALFSLIGARAVFGSQLERGQAPSCLIGAVTNFLFVSTSLALVANRYLTFSRPRSVICSLMACLAAAGTIGVLVPLTFGIEKFGISIGYAVWVGSAGLLAIAARRLSTAGVEPHAPASVARGIA